MNNINNIRSSNTNARGNNPMSYQKHTGNSNFVPQAPNPSGFTVLAATHNPRHFLNNQGDMKSNHMANMAHGQIQIVPNPANIPHRQQALYMPGSHIQAYQGNGSHAYYQYPPQTSQGAVIVPFIQNYSSNQQNIYYNTTSSRPMVNIPQGLQNTPVASMNAALSTAQNSHGPSLIVQPQPMEMTSNSQPLQVQQQQPSTPMQPQEPRPQKRAKTIIKITHPETGAEIDLHDNAAQVVATPSPIELEKMKVQSQFQSLVQSVVQKDDSKVSDDNQNNEGGEKVRNEFASQVKKLASNPNNSDLEDDDIPTKSIEEVEAQSPEEVSVIEESDFIVDDVSIEKIDSTSTIDLCTNTEEVLDIPKNDNETKTNPSLSSTSTLELPPPNTDIAIVPEESNIKKNPDEQSVKPVKSKKSKNKKKKNVVAETDETIINVQLPKDNEPVVTQENKENEFVLPIDNEDVSQPEPQKEEMETETQVIEIQPEVVHKLPSYLDKLPYAEGQWSVTNQTGNRIYSKSFLLQLGNEPICQKKPDVLKSWIIITKSSNQPSYGHASLGTSVPRSQSASATGFMPAYLKTSSSQRGGMPVMQPGVKRNSSQGKTASKTAKPNTIHMSLSLREEVKLNQTENAWVPTAAKKATKVDVSKNKDEDELKTEEVNKSVRSILNKITPDNMGPLTERFRALPIDTVERLEKTIDLVFEKAIEEQSFAPLYASLCSAMQSVQVTSGEGGNKKTFKKLIISKCQSLFELDKAQEMDSAKKLSEITSCKDPEKKKVLQLEFEENERRLRKRSVGNCRFIGELFKQKILTPNIMLYCIVNLVTKHVEEPLECLCNLLKTVGKELEQSYNLNDTFDKLKHLTSKEMKSKIPSRIRFMIQDVIDLRKDKWTPRRNDSKPKLINEIENDAKNEAMEQSMALSSFNRPEKQQRDHHRGDEKFRGGEGRDNRDKNRRIDNTEWNVVQNTKYKQQNYTIDQSKLQGFKEPAVTTLGPSSKWSFSNNSSSGNKNSSFTSSNTFAALNDDKKSSTASQMMSNKNTSRKPIISESEERQRMMSGVASMMPQFAQTSLAPNSISSSLPSKETTTTIEEPVNVELAPEIVDKINSLCKSILHEYSQMQNLDDIVYSLTEDTNSVIKTRHQEFVKAMALITLDSSPSSRIEAGKIFAELLSYKHKDNVKAISVVDITQGIDAVLKDWNDYLMDYPQFFSYIADIIVPLLISKTACFEISNLKDSCISICPDNASVFFTKVLHKILSSKETQNIKEQVGGILWVYNKWRLSEYVPLDVFMPISQINKHFKNDRVGVFLLSVTIYDKMKMTDRKLLFEIMQSWITTNISAEIIKCPQFMRALTIAIVMMCLKPINNSFEDVFDHVNVKLLTCFLQIAPQSEIKQREVQCLYGIQIMSAALEHPGGMVLKLFHKLYEDSVISKESFELWKKEYEFKVGFDEDLETKTMAVVVLNSFFLSFPTNDSDDDDAVDQ